MVVLERRQRDVGTLPRASWADDGAHPAAGIIQTVAMPTGRDTLYARIQQFAQRVYGPLFTAGIHFWHLGEAYYWGHTRSSASSPSSGTARWRGCRRAGRSAASCCRHDFVEAALKRRAGWHVWVAYGLAAAGKRCRRTLLEELRRDRPLVPRHLQHSRLFSPRACTGPRALFIAGVMA